MTSLRADAGTQGWARAARWFGFVGGVAMAFGACGSEPKPEPEAPKFNAAYVELVPADFQSTIDGKSTDLYTIKNSHGLFAKLTNLGAKFEQIVVPDK